MASSVRDRLKLTEKQKTQLAELQNEADDKLDAILRDEQRKLFRQMQDMAKAFAGGLPGGLPGGFRAFGGDGLFRAPRYAPDFPGLAGKDLTPGKLLEEVQAEDSPPSPWAKRQDK